jgi:Na+-transporting NADH:ubiquinone oxidoreductase subunit NqrB
MRYSSGTYRKLAIAALVLGIVFLGTSGVQFVFKGNSKGETGTVIGVAGILVCVQMWTRAKRVGKDE